MKKIIVITTLLVIGVIRAQSSTENYVHTRTYLEPTATTNTTIKQVESVQYFDGLGRLRQEIDVKASPTGKDIVSHLEYDAYGIQTKGYLPLPQAGTQNGAIYSSPLGNVQAVYGSEKIYSEKILENSPLNRILQQVQVGNAWSVKPVTFGYDTNTDTEVSKYTTVTSWTEGRTQSSLTLSGKYSAGMLYKNSTVDEDGNKTEEFKNKKGQVILLRKSIGAINADTYYVYNEYGQLVYTLPPLAVEAGTLDPAMLDNLCYQYRYDSWNRQVEKKIPGKGWEYMVYDRQDRLVAGQDAELKKNGQWLYTKYDQFGRVAFSGISAGADRNSEQILADGFGSNNVKRTGSVFFNIEGMDVYYDPNGTYPNTNWVKLLSVNYYDTYPLYSFNPDFPQIVFGASVLKDTPSGGMSTKGLPVMSVVKNIENDSWTKNYIYYDTKGRAAGGYSINHLDGYTKTESQFDFAGVPQKIVTEHKRLTEDKKTIITQTFEYDHRNRLTKHWHQVNGNPRELLSENTYNELSQLSGKKVGNNLQAIDYTYNIRGWLTRTNNPADLNGKLFGYELKYNNPVNSHIGPGRFNGNIAEMDWKNSTENILKRYSYAYDRFNRLNDAIYSEPNATVPFNSNFNELLTYDLNGNIKTLKRNAFPFFSNTSTVVDDLEYRYTGNRLNQVIESSLNDTGYEGGNNVIGYDLNGNMIDMKDKGINSITYNYLNLSNQFAIDHVSLGRTTSIGIENLYRADGTKLRKTYTVYGGRGGTNTIKMTDYLDGFQYTYTDLGSPCITCRTEVAYEEMAYKNIGILDPIPATPGWILDFTPTAEGFYSFAENRYIYQYKDHLGNARVSFVRNNAGAPEVIDTNNYYPFGLNHIGGFSTSKFGSLYSFKYNGKELQETGMFSYGWREYMPDLGRWNGVDQLAEKYGSTSPFAYVVNNPVSLIDPDGRWMDYAGHIDTSGYSNPFVLMGKASLMTQFMGLNPGDGVGGGGPTMGQLIDEYNGKSSINPGNVDFTKFDFTQYGATDCCPGGSLTGTLTEGASVSKGGAVGVIWYVANTVFGSAHIPDHSNWAYRYSVTRAPLTVTDVKKEYKVRERDTRTGSYTIIFGNDQKYHGKGSIERMFTSAILKMTAAQTTVKSFDWIPSVSHREAFKAEYRRMQTDAVGKFDEGYKNPINYNLIQSPGKKYEQQDGY